MAKASSSVQDPKDQKELTEQSELVSVDTSATSEGSAPAADVAGTSDAPTPVVPSPESAPSADATAAPAQPPAPPPIDDRVIVGAVLMNARFYKRGDERAFARAMQGRSVAHLFAANAIRGDWSERPDETPDPAADTSPAARRTTSRHRRRR